MKNYFIPAIALAALLNSASGAQEADNEDPNSAQGSSLAQNIETQLSVSLFGQVYPPSLGGQSVAVFIDLSKSGSGVRNRYYILPYFKPDFSGFETSVESVCEDGVGDNQEVYASLQFEIASKEVNQEIVQLINSELSEPTQQIRLGQLQPYPFASLSIVAGAKQATSSSPAKQLFRFPITPNALGASGIQSTTVSFQTQIGNTPISIEGTCEELHEIAERKDLTAFILAPHGTFTRNSISINYFALFGSSSYRSIFSEESQSGSIITESGSSGLGLNINLGSFNLGADLSAINASVTDNRSRAITRDVLDRAIQNFVQSTTIIVYNERLEDAPTRQEIITLTTSMIEAFSATTQLQIKTIQDSQFALLLSTSDSVPLSDGQNKLLLSGKAAPEFASNWTTAVTGEDGSTYNVTSDNKYKDARGVNWENTGDGWVPTSLDITIVTESMIRNNSGVFIDSLNVVKNVENYQLITLTTIVNAGPIPDIEPLFLNIEPIKFVERFDRQVISTQIMTFNMSRYRQVGGNPRPEPIAAPETISEIACGWRPEMPSGTVVVGNEPSLAISIEIDRPGIGHLFPGSSLGDLHCVNNAICSSTASSFCLSEIRNEGCYVSRDWLTWYRAREIALKDTVIPGKQERINFICQD